MITRRNTMYGCVGLIALAVIVGITIILTASVVGNSTGTVENAVVATYTPTLSEVQALSTQVSQLQAQIVASPTPMGTAQPTADGFATFTAAGTATNEALAGTPATIDPESYEAFAEGLSALWNGFTVVNPTAT